MIDSMRTVSGIVVIVGGGPATTPELAVAVADVPDTAVVIAADSGLELAARHGLHVDHVVGDLDSVDPEQVRSAAAAGAQVHRFPADKDATDSELALDLAKELAVPGGEGGSRLVVLGAGGGRLDHLLADLSSLLSPRLAAMEVSARFGRAAVNVVRPGRRRLVVGTVGEHVSLLALHGRVRGVTTTGLRWALVDADVVPGSTRAISNELVATEAGVSVTDGALLVIRPGHMATPVDPRSTPYDPTPRA